MTLSYLRLIKQGAVINFAKRKTQFLQGVINLFQNIDY